MCFGFATENASENPKPCRGIRHFLPRKNEGLGNYGGILVFITRNLEVLDSDNVSRWTSYGPHNTTYRSANDTILARAVEPNKNMAFEE